MCGIVGYLGERSARDVIHTGLRAQQYRGYDAAGFAVVQEGLHIRRTVGDIDALQRVTEDVTVATIGIGHTRWATHGDPHDPKNAHPHPDCANRFVIVHNGTITNADPMREELLARGHMFSSQTDSESFAHLLEECGGGYAGFRLAISQIQGTYAILAMDAQHPDTIMAARHVNPLCVGFGDREVFFASDPCAFAKWTRSFARLPDGWIVCATRQGVACFDSFGDERELSRETLATDIETPDKDGQPHFMMKEMLEQPRVAKQTYEAAQETGMAVPRQEVIIVGCGSAYHAGCFARACGNALGYSERITTCISTEVPFEYVYEPHDVSVIAVSQSGTTIDTLDAIARFPHAHQTIGVVNVPESDLTKSVQKTIYTKAGTETAVASTKAFMSQSIVLLDMVVRAIEARGTMEAKNNAATTRAGLGELSACLLKILDRRHEVEQLANTYADITSASFIGHGMLYPIAMEGALKFKEITYIPATAYPSGELKHGPLALIDPHHLVVAICPAGSTRHLTDLALHKVHSRGGRILVVTTKEGEALYRSLGDVIVVPDMPEAAWALVSVVPLQLLAYYMSVARGYNPDQPRNLAKSVTTR